MADDAPLSIAVPLIWVGLDDVPIQMASNFVGQIASDNEVIITAGQAAPPLVLGTPEEIREQIGQVRFVPVRPIVRMSMTAQRLEEFITVLQQTLENHKLRAAES